MVPRLPALLASLAALLALSACSGDDSGEPTAADPNSDSASAPASEGACTYSSDGQPAAKDVELPPSDPTVSGEQSLTISTNIGEINGTLDADATPCTVNSFASLAEQGYFDATRCHRLTTSGIYVLQCGDPTASGSGGPGYSFEDELSGEETYGAGTLAMANAGPNTNGSQFFIVYGDTQLPPSYTVFGQVDEDAVALVEGVAKKGTDNGTGDGAPKQSVEIESVTVG